MLERRRRDLLRPHASLACLVPFGLLLCTGCASWSYKQVSLGQGPSEYDRRLPSDTSRRTPIGLCDLRERSGGNADALLVLLGTDRRVTAKFHAQRAQRNYGVWGQRRYTLIGEIDLARSGLPANEPTDALRAIFQDIANARADQHARQAHEWVAAGILRLIQARAPDADPGIPSETLESLIARVPGGGAGSVNVADGVLHVTYEDEGGEK